ncbi:MAG: permease-like cell division protein FtsX [Gaiellales bacterium]
MRSKLFIGEALRSITANLSTTIAATMTVLIGMFLLGLFIALGSWVVSWTDHVKEEVVLKVFFERDVGSGAVNKLAVQIKQRDDVASVVAVSPDEALEQMREQFPEMVETLSENPLPWALEITPIVAENVETIAASLEPPPANVDKVTYEKETTDKILRTAGIVEIIFLGASLILLAAAIILIANTIRLSIFARRREIEVMKLVGATNWFVRGPFMLEGLICGLVGSVLAIILLFIGREVALPAMGIDAIQNAGSDVQAWAFPAIAVILLAAGLLIGALGSGITIRRFLRV